MSNQKPRYITKIHSKINQLEKLSLHKPAKAFYIFSAFAKSEAEPGNSNYLSLANISTPFNRAFFVRSLRTPQESTAPQNRARGSLSMVAFGGKGFALCCFPVMTVFQPVKRYRPTLESEAIAPFNFTGAIKMLYKFLCLNRTKPTYNQEAVYIEADTEENARFQLTADYRLLLDRPIAKFAKKPQNVTACKAQGGVYA